MSLWRQRRWHTPEKPKSCRICRVCSFSGSHFQDLCGFSVPASGSSKWREHHKSPKVVDFVRSAPFPEAISKAPVDFLEIRLLGPPKWREHHKSPKVVDFVEFAPFRWKQDSCRFPVFSSFLEPPKWREPQKPKSCRFCRVRSFCGSFSLINFLEFRHLELKEPQKSREIRKICNFLPFRTYFGQTWSGRSHQPESVRENHQIRQLSRGL